MIDIAQSLAAIRNELPARVRLLAVSKTKPAEAVIQALGAEQTEFGENYVQEGVAKIAQVHRLNPKLAATACWHLIGPLQSNKCVEVAQHFDWLQSLDRSKLVPLLAKARPAQKAALQVLIQVNIDDESSKSGIKADELHALATEVLKYPTLYLRGLMCIPNPQQDRARSFHAMWDLFASLQRELGSQIDTLSMGMSDDYRQSIEAGSTMIRIGSAIFGSR